MPSKKRQEQINNNPLKQVASVGLPLLSGAIGLVAICCMVGNPTIMKIDAAHAGTSLSALLSFIFMLLFAVSGVTFGLLSHRKAKSAEAFLVLNIFSIAMIAMLYCVQTFASSVFNNIEVVELTAEKTVSLYETFNQKLVITAVATAITTFALSSIYYAIRGAKQKHQYSNACFNALRFTRISDHKH